MFSSEWLAARALAEEQRWLLGADQARACGLNPGDMAAALRRGRARSLYHGVYLLDPDAGGQVTWEQWCAAALLAHGHSACLVGWSGARAAGAEGLPSSDPSIDVAVVGVGSRHRRRANTGLSDAPGKSAIDGPPIIVRQWSVRPDEVEIANGLRVRRAELSVIDAALTLDRVHALCLFDWAIRTGVHSPQSLQALAVAMRRRPGVVHVREMASLADGRAGSPLESRVRLACIDADLAPDDLQYPVLDSRGGVVGYGDLAWLRRRTRPLIGEADGREVHSRLQAVLYDRRRANEFVTRSCDIVRFTWSDALRPVYVQQIVRAALAA